MTTEILPLSNAGALKAARDGATMTDDCAEAPLHRTSAQQGVWLGASEPHTSWPQQQQHFFPPVERRQTRSSARFAGQRGTGLSGDPRSARALVCRTLTYIGARCAAELERERAVNDLRTRAPTAGRQRQQPCITERKLAVSGES